MNVPVHLLAIQFYVVHSYEWFPAKSVALRFIFGKDDLSMVQIQDNVCWIILGSD